MFEKDIYFSGFRAVYNFGGYYSVPSGTNWYQPPHKFEQCKFYYITGGECVISVEGKEYHATAGDCFFIPAKATHGYQNDKNMPFAQYWMHFDLYPDVGIFETLNLPYCVKVDANGRVTRLFEELTAALSGGSFCDRLTVTARLIELIGEYIKAAGADVTDVAGKTDERLDSLLRYISENLDKELDNELLAQKYFSHPNHFVRAFKAKVGQTPAKYVRAKRMESAKRLLEGTTLSVSEIAAKVGVPDPAHLSRLFRESYGMPPSVYREYYKNTLVL